MAEGGKEKIGLREKLIPVRVSSINDLARIAASIVTLGQTAYILRFPGRNGKKVYGLVALLRDYYDLYGLPILYYVIDDKVSEKKGHYILVKVDESGEHVEISETTRPGWITVPIIDLAEKPRFFPDEV